jgi:hypothetical protein
MYLCPPVTGWPSHTPGHRVRFTSASTTRRATVEIFSLMEPHNMTPVPCLLCLWLWLHSSEIVTVSYLADPHCLMTIPGIVAVEWAEDYRSLQEWITIIWSMCCARTIILSWSICDRLGSISIIILVLTVHYFRCPRSFRLNGPRQVPLPPVTVLVSEF